MTKLLEQAIARLQSLPEARQDQVASLVLHELDDDAQREATTAKHADKLGKLVDEILDEDSRGLTDDLDVDRL